MKRPENKEKCSIARKGKPIFALRGVNHYCWKGGVTPINEAIRKSLEYRIWRRSVFERDKYACVICGKADSGNLNADHIKPFALFPELRFDLDNGRTLCVPCHRKTPTYGRKTRLTINAT